MFKSSSGVEYRENSVEKASFYLNKVIDELITDTEVRIHF